MLNIEELKNKAALIRKWSLISTTEVGSGHPTSCLSPVEITTILFEKYFNYDIKYPKNPNNDKLIFSKGHAAPLLYTLFALTGAFPLKELLNLRKYGSRLEGHPTPNFPYADAATGSLGQGLSIGAGMAYALKAQISNSKFQIANMPKVYVLLGDGECEEGQIYEAASFASYYNLNNLIAILDVNGLELRGKTMFGHDVKKYQNIFSSIGFKTLVIDGHDFYQIDDAFKDAINNKTEKPVMIIANTVKGKGVSFLEGREDLHGKPLSKEELEKALSELPVDEKIEKSPILFNLRKPQKKINSKRNLKTLAFEDKNSYNIGSEVSTREAFGDVLAAIGKLNKSVYSLDADVSNSTGVNKFKKELPDQFIQCFIAEQNMVGIAVGLSTQGKIPFAATFAAFLTRAFDQIRMSSISRANIKFVGSHAGVSIGEDGPSQMGLEDIAMFGTLPDSIVLHPSDAVSTAKLIPQLVLHVGISYLRTLRPKTPVLYDMDESFSIGGSKILKKSKIDLLTVVAAGITVHEALKAYDILKEKGIMIRVVDCYSIKPIDQKTLIKCISETKKNVIITVEDHFEHGGLGDFVLSALSKNGAIVEKMAVDHISRSGLKDELLADAGINAASIVKKVKQLIK
ncbi:MAG: transketolase [Candidatus Levybacteria bacterium]|nr:transketolase [Candidatus Levybacteria bacterium]